MEKVVQFLKDAEVYYLATVDGDQPRVRPFGTVNVFDGKLYIQTGKVKEVSRQIHANPKVEICAFKNGAWLRVAGELVEDERIEAKKAMLDAYPSLQGMYSADDDNTQVTATRTCGNDSTHVETEIVNTASVVKEAATCEKAGTTTYTATFTKEAFTTVISSKDNP